MPDFFKNTAIMEKALDASWLRNEAISNNIANVDTPGYKRQTVEFEKFLAEALENKGVNANRADAGNRVDTINQKDLDDIPIKITQDRSNNQMRLDKNNVDIDHEMSQLAKNNIYYNAVVTQLSKQFNRIKNTIRDIR